MDVYEKLRILADSAKFDVSCSSSGSNRSGAIGQMGNAAKEGICHSWAADGRCISLLKVLFTNKCEFNCEYCVNRRTADCERASFEPYELADLTIEFYKRNYIEGLFLSSAVEVSPDYTAERILECLRILREERGFCGYIHAKIIPGVSQEITHRIGMYADRLSVNLELPTQETLAMLAPQKKPKSIFSSMRQITNTLIEHNALVAPGTMFKGQNLNTAEHYLGGIDYLQDMNGQKTTKKALKTKSKSPKSTSASFLHTNDEGSFSELALSGGFSSSSKGIVLPDSSVCNQSLVRKGSKKELFAPAGQTTQMIIGAAGESDLQILNTTSDLYNMFKMKRVYYSAYIPVTNSPLLPDVLSAPPLAREHRLYQADWLLRFYGFTADEILDEENPNLELELDPKINWALRHIEKFPVEINTANIETLMRIPGIGYVSAKRIIQQRKCVSVKFDDLKKMGVVIKRAKYFLTCGGKYYGNDSGFREPNPDKIRTLAIIDEAKTVYQGFSKADRLRIKESLLYGKDGEQLSMFSMG